MSWFNRIGEIASTVATDAWKMGTAIPRFAWDVATAPFNDDEHYNGFVNTLSTATKKLEQNAIVKPATDLMKVPGVQPALDALNTVNREVLYRPVTTALLINDDINKKGGSLLSIFDPNELKKAYNGSRDISLGQAAIGGFAQDFNKNFNIYDPKQREETFKKNLFGKVASGAVDFTKDLTLDVSRGAGKALKASTLGAGYIGNSAEKAAKAAEEISRAQIAGETNRFTPVLKNFAKNDKVYALNHPLVKESNNPTLLAHLLGESNNINEVGDVLRAAIGDPHAMADLAASRAHMSDALKAARGDLSAVDQYKLFSAPDGSGMLPFINEDKNVIAEAEANYASLAKTDKRFADMMEIGKGGGILNRTTGTLANPIDDFIAKSRSMKFYDKAVGSPSVEVYQPTPFHRLYQKISWAAGERPAGVIDLNDPDSYKEVIATLGRATKTGAVNEADAGKLLNTYISATTPEARLNAVTSMESSIARAIAEKHGIDINKVDELYNNVKTARMSAMRSIKDRGYMLDQNGEILKVPQFESQTADYTSIMDFDLLDKVLKRQANTLNTLPTVRARAGQVADTFVHAADTTQDLFKAAALLRLGYTIRNGIDSQLRIAASVGAMASLRHLGPGLKNIIFNTVKQPIRTIDNYFAAGMWTPRQIEGFRNEIATEIRDKSARLKEVDAKLSIHPDDPNLVAEKNTIETLIAEKQPIYDHYVDILAKSKGPLDKQKIGSGSFKHTTSDGITYELPDAFGGKLGNMFRNLTSSARSFQRIVDTNTQMLSKHLASNGIGVVNPEDVGYFDQWAQTLNRQFGNSAVVKKLANGESVDDVAKWLASSPEGRDLRRRLQLSSSESAEYVTRANGFLDQYLPETSALRSKLGEITPNDLRKAFRDTTALPSIHGHVLEENLANKGVIAGRQLINGAFHFLGSMPEDAWARHPLYVHLYRQDAARRLDVLSGLKKETVSPAEQAEIMAAAHKTAQRDMKRILFNIERRSNLAAAMKFISPFFSAQENAYKTWGKMALANPAIINRGNMIWNAPNRAGLVTDQNGQTVPAGRATDNDTIWVQLPKGVSKIPFVGKGLESLDNMGIPKKSLDVVFGGGMDTLYNKGASNVFSDVFPIGPYVGIPISEVVKRQPGLEDAYKWALPYGPNKGLVDGMLPAWFKRAQTLAAGQNSAEFAKTYQNIWNTEAHTLKNNGQEIPSNFEDIVMKKAQDFYKMRIAASLILPFAPKFDSPYRLYMDQYKEYKRAYGLEADTKFLQDYPDFFDFATSLSANKTGVQADVDSVKFIQANKGLVSKLYGIEPALVGLVANNPTGYQFSQAAYDWLYNTKVSPGRQENFFANSSPADAQVKNEAKKGWVVYRSIMNSIDDEVSKRGLISVNSKGAEDLKAIKTAVIDQLSHKLDKDGKPMVDPKTGQFQQSAWYVDYTDTDGSKTNRVVNGLSTILQSDFGQKALSGKTPNPTWTSVDVYLKFRQAIASELAQRKVKSIDAKANSDLRATYDAIVSKLTDVKHGGDAGFADLYNRFLTQDLLYDKYLTPKAVK